MRAWLALIALFAGTGASAGQFDGTYRLSDGSDCSRVGKDGGALRVADGIFYGVETECRMTKPVQVRDMAGVLYDMECSGEGSLWSERALFLTGANGGLILVWDGYAFSYPRCAEN